MSSFTVRNCDVLCCDGQQFIKLINGKAVIPTWELFEIECHWTKNIEKLCRPVCPSDKMCKLHRLLDVFNFFSNNVRSKNIKEDIIISKIMIKEQCKHPYCMNAWCFEIYERKYIGKDASLAMRSSFLSKKLLSEQCIQKNLFNYIR